MKNKLILSSMSAVLSLGLLSACGVDDTRMNDTDGADYTPVRYNQNDNGRNNNNGIFDRDHNVFDDDLRRNARDVDPVEFDMDEDLDLDMDDNDLDITDQDNRTRNNGILRNNNTGVRPHGGNMGTGTR